MKRLGLLFFPILLSACAGMQDYRYQDEENSDPALVQQMEMYVYPDTQRNKRSRSYGHVLNFSLYEVKGVKEQTYSGGGN